MDSEDEKIKVEEETSTKDPQKDTSKKTTNEDKAPTYGRFRPPSR